VPCSNGARQGMPARSRATEALSPTNAERTACVHTQRNLTSGMGMISTVSCFERRRSSSKDALTRVDTQQHDASLLAIQGLW